MYAGEHHKTNKSNFKFGIPFILLIEMALLIAKYKHLF
jgi:uncharacterized membrane protein YsdA (DUF1294 family)